MTNHRYFMIKTHYFSQFITKMGFCYKILSLNDLTPSPISRPGTGYPLFTLTTSQRACKPVMTTQAFSRRNQHRAKALCWKSGGRKKVLVMLGYHSIEQMLSIWHDKSDFLKKLTFNRAQDVVRKPLVYFAHCVTSWSQGSHSNSAREISRAIFSRGGVGRHVVQSVCYTKLL